MSGEGGSERSGRPDSLSNDGSSASDGAPAQRVDVRARDRSGPEAHTPLLEVKDLVKYFPVKSSGLIRRTIDHLQAVDGVSFELNSGDALVLLREFGCGKSTTVRVLAKL